ncbi:hypothetical protein ACOSP7_009799 [Xanthoceras sorbifolium]
MGPPPSLSSLPPALPVTSKDKGKKDAHETQLARVEQPARERLSVERGIQPNKVIQLNAPEVTPSSSDWTLGSIAMEFLEWAPTLVEDFLTKGLSRHIEEDQGVVLLHFLLCYSLILHAYKDELATKVELEKKLTQEAKRCQALRKEMDTAKAKYKYQIHELKEEIERAKVDLKHSYKLLEWQAGELAKKE